MPQFNSDSVIRQNVTPGTFGSETSTPRITVDKNGQVTQAEDVAIKNLPSFPIPPLPDDENQTLDGTGKFSATPFFRAMITRQGGLVYNRLGQFVLRKTAS